MNQPTSALRLKTGQAKKLGQRSEGCLTYELLTNEARQYLWIRVVANEGGGYFSKECVEFSAIAKSIDVLSIDASFPAKRFASAFVGRSSCNPGFLSAVLVTEMLLAPSPTTPFQLIRAGDWDKWCKEVLERPGEPIVLVSASEGQDAAKPLAEGESSAVRTVDHTERKKTVTKSPDKGAGKHEARP